MWTNADLWLLVPSPTSYLLPYANFEWRDEKTPFALDYSDVYWSNQGGLAEKQYVFVEGCRLAERWQSMPDSSHFSIAELGLGFGLNLLLTLRSWNTTQKSARCTLDYLSYEQHLVPIEAIGKIAQQFGLEREYRLLQNKYPQPVPGNHTIWLNDSFCLHLIVGDAISESEPLTGQFDALFLDGFSPSKNESIWQEGLVRAFSQRLRPGGITTTYSVAGRLRRCLADNGLIVEKTTGYGTKRHMLRATAPGSWSPLIISKQKIAIVGAGLTGLLSAEAISRYGHDVTIIDSQPRYGAVCSINQIAIYPQLSQTPQPYSNLYLRAFRYFQNHRAFNQTGRLELLDSAERIHKGEMLAQQLEGFVAFVSAAESSRLLGFEVSHPGLFTPDAGWIEPQSICPDLPVLNSRVDAVTPREDGWDLTLSDGLLEVDTAVLATGPNLFKVLEPLGLMALRGQSLRVNNTQRSPNCVMSGQKTWFPSVEFKTCDTSASQTTSTVSGTYSRFDFDTSVRDEDTRELLDAITPYLKDEPEHSAQVGIRSATRDRLPVVDQLPDWQKLDEHLTASGPSAKGFDGYQQSLYASVGFGSHAGTLGPYCAELLTRKINQQPIAEDTSQISSTRFRVRDFTKR